MWLKNVEKQSQKKQQQQQKKIIITAKHNIISKISGFKGTGAKPSCLHESRLSWFSAWRDTNHGICSHCMWYLMSRSPASSAAPPAWRCSRWAPGRGRSSAGGSRWVLRGLRPRGTWKKAALTTIVRKTSSQRTASGSLSCFRDLWWVEETADLGDSRPLRPLFPGPPPPLSLYTSTLPGCR